MGNYACSEQVLEWPCSLYVTNSVDLNSFRDCFVPQLRAVTLRLNLALFPHPRNNCFNFAVAIIIA